MQRDLCLGESPGGWSLFQSPLGRIYLGCHAPGEEEYILPLRADIIETFQNLFHKHSHCAPESVAEDAETTDETFEDSVYIYDDVSNEDVDDIDEWDGIDGGDAANGDVLSLRPGRDRVTGSGDDIIGYVTPFGVPYFLHNDYCVVCDALPFRIAFGLLNSTEDADIIADMANPISPKIHLRQGELHLTFHLTHIDGFKPECADGVIHATPLLLIGTYKGKRLHLSHQD